MMAREMGALHTNVGLYFVDAADAVADGQPPPPYIGPSFWEEVQRMKEILALLILLLQVVKAFLDDLNR
ncbi:hypothetical protein [Azospirillum griseum]|uniref:Uncharacterized protein n=1 Tax=Azospirillum griseum TaxID=2496639 RepID=A0A3S0JEI0_9PROT|nr:hypothetical protein [Azospirillum griseum]RTR15029.1 hypothetical protein EJ903_23435 [Azospirillum griseum]